MNSERIVFKDYLRAELYGAGSVAEMLFPPLQKLTKNTEAPHIMVRWRHLRVPVASIDKWLSYPGAEDGGGLPKDFPEAAIIGIPKPELDALQDKTGGRHAVAYLLGKSAVLLGAPREQRFFGVSEDGSEYRVAMGIGGGEAQLTAGLVVGRRYFIEPTTPLIDHGRVPADEVTDPFA